MTFWIFPLIPMSYIRSRRQSHDLESSQNLYRLLRSIRPQGSFRAPAPHRRATQTCRTEAAFYGLSAHLEAYRGGGVSGSNGRWVDTGYRRLLMRRGRLYLRKRVPADVAYRSAGQMSSSVRFERVMYDKLSARIALCRVSSKRNGRGCGKSATAR